jgi:hypothetical protein
MKFIYHTTYINHFRKKVIAIIIIETTSSATAAKTPTNTTIANAFAIVLNPNALESIPSPNATMLIRTHIAEAE